MTTPLRRTVRPRPGLDLVLSEAGGGPPVLLLHGAPGPGSIGPLIDHFSPRHRVLAPVHPGWDDTARPGGLDSVPALAALYLDLLGHLDLSDVTVLGTSFGGWVAAQMAVDDRHHRISRLVLMDAIGPVVPGQPVTLPSGPPPAAPSPAAAAPAPRTGPPPQTLTALRAYAGPDLQDPGLLPRLAAFTRPVLVVWGENDQVVTPAYGRAYAAAFPHARLELIPGAGHLPIREEPEAAFAAIDRFLA
ncbi:pimeloyl-ACP methyl ester carboxylesterase [Thermocatellispora tengchongensis]|uniref:Pimeloyl-ACP methyl ester carboxylesterase n=1 Tax=Thermocatellispora tengchongensis TaxID=1073253 RepID=A0A840PNN9_9ACTN|nr:alpha/beta hydrolase [Thermocatellispora tengchongensis]MBB5139653.1 pimeloyl-ACP methyl ester carboxylesterase [Thermocatellispora tengchongensis]